MIDLAVWKKAWALLDAREQRNAWVVLGVVIIGALSSALMVGSVLPFLSVLAEPGRIETVPALAWAYESFGFSSDYSFLIGLGLASFGVIVLTSLMQIVKTWAVARFALMRMHTISHRLLAAYLRQPYAFFLDRHSGEMGTRILAETGQVVNQFFRPAAELIASLLTVIAILGLLLLAEPVVAVVAFAVLGGLYGGVYALSRRALNRFGRVRVAANSARFRIANEALGGIKDIKLLGREGSYVARYAQPSRRMARTVVAVQVISQVPQFVLQAVAFGGIILLCLLLMDAQGLASGAALGGILPVLGLFAFAGQRLMPELSKLYRSLAVLQAGAAAVDTIHDDLVGHAGGGTLPQVMPAGLGLTRQLRLENVSYSYPDAAHAGVRDITLEIRAGEKIGVVGGTGAGKTTLADIMLGLLAPHKRADRRRWRPDHRQQPARLAAKRGLRAAGHLPDRCQRDREYCPRCATAGDRSGPGRGSGAHRAAGRVHSRRAAAGLRHHDRRTRGSAVGRAAAAYRYRAGDVSRCRFRGLRRGDERARHPDRGRGDGRDRLAAEREDGADDRPQAEHGRALRPHRADGSRPHRRDGQLARTGGREPDIPGHGGPDGGGVRGTGMGIMLHIGLPKTRTTLLQRRIFPILDQNKVIKYHGKESNVPRTLSDWFNSH